MVASNRHRFDNEKTPSQATFQLDDEALVAYLDGELTGEQVATVESGLQSNSDLRDRLGQLKQSWELLDELPEEKPSPKFAQSTMEMIVLSEDRAAASGRRRLALLRKLGIMAAACLGLIFIAYVATHQYQRSQNRQALNDLPILADWNAFKHIDSFEWLQKLESIEDLIFVGGQSTGAGDQSNKIGLGLGIVPATKREEWVAKLSDTERSQLAANRDDFQRMLPPDREKICTTVKAVYASPESTEKYLKVARAYQKVLAGLSGTAIDELKDLKIDERYSVVSQKVNSKMIGVFGVNLPAEDRATIVQWLAKMEDDYDSLLPPQIQRNTSVTPPTGSRVLAYYFRRRNFPSYGNSVIEEADLTELTNSLSAKAQQILSRTDGAEGLEDALVIWLFAVVWGPTTNARPPTANELMAEYEKLSDARREEIEYMLPEKARNAVRPGFGPGEGRGRGELRRGPLRGPFPPPQIRSNQ